MMDPQLRRAVYVNEIGHMLTYMAGLFGAIVIALGPAAYADLVVGASLPIVMAIGMASVLLAVVWLVLHMSVAHVLYGG